MHAVIVKKQRVRAGRRFRETVNCSENHRDLSELVGLARPWFSNAQGGSRERSDLEDVHVDRRLRE
jgi:hypothetical protein